MPLWATTWRQTLPSPPPRTSTRFGERVARDRRLDQGLGVDRLVRSVSTMPERQVEDAPEQRAVVDLDATEGGGHVALAATVDADARMAALSWNWSSSHRSIVMSVHLDDAGLGEEIELGRAGLV